MVPTQVCLEDQAWPGSFLRKSAYESTVEGKSWQRMPEKPWLAEKKSEAFDVEADERGWGGLCGKESKGDKNTWAVSFSSQMGACLPHVGFAVPHSSSVDLELTGREFSETLAAGSL